ncbi:MAG: hypothetical protein HYX68_05050 [Planctomycetes bacterium]|nr:hypothetical protein [Planctomycetota bacterium]
MRAPKFVAVALLALLFVGCGEKPLTEYSDGPGKFKVLFPGSPKVETTTGQNNVHVKVFSVESFSWAYTLNYYDSPIPLPKDPNFTQLAMTKEVEGIYTGLKGQKASQTSVKLQNQYAGLDHSGTVTKPKNLNVRGRIYIVGNRVYNILVMGSADKVKGETATKFLDSFKAEP